MAFACSWQLTHSADTNIHAATLPGISLVPRGWSTLDVECPLMAIENAFIWGRSWPYLAKRIALAVGFDR